jgi:hypothetical protein
LTGKEKILDIIWKKYFLIVVAVTQKNMTQDTFNNNDATDERVIISYSYSHPNQPDKGNKTTTNNKSKKTQKPTQKHRYSIKKAISALEPENK